jgi:ribosomal protein S18 acetylase RimI-like enzyme
MGETTGVVVRPIRPEDKDALRVLHEACFPIAYEDSFYDKTVNSADGISGWVACQHNDQLHRDEIVGVITARTTAAERDAQDLLSPDMCGATTRRQACYILTLGVKTSARRQGIASQLLLLVLRSCLESPSCKLVYLHTLTTNAASLQLYQRHAFRVSCTERRFYHIAGAHADAFVLCLYMNGGRPPFSALGTMRYAGESVKLWSASLWNLIAAKQ